MTFSPQLEAKFAKLMTSYPPGRHRGALVPMLLFAQDEVGACTQEVIEEIARRLGLFPLQVNYDFHHNVTPEKLDEILDSAGKSN